MAAALDIILEFVRGAAGGDPYAFDFRPQAYLLRSRGGGFVTAEFAWTPAFLADLEALRRAAHGVASATAERERMLRVGEALRGFVAPLGWAKLEADIATTVQDGGTVHVLVRSAAAELYAIPWELLVVTPLGQHLAALPRVRIAYLWPDVRVTPAAPTPARARVLVAWSAAAGQVPASEHAAAIAGACQAAGVAFVWDDDVLPHASLTALAARLDAAAAAGRPVGVLHLLCHGVRTDSGVALALDGEQPGDDPAAVSPGHLAQLLGRHATSLRLVVLAACEGAVDSTPGTHLGSVALAIHRIGVEAVVASRYALSIDGSTLLCESLYPALLAESAALEDAIGTARAALALVTPRIDWIAVQLYGHAADDGGTRPLALDPFCGLAPFTPERRRFFTGRAAEVERLVECSERLIADAAPRMIAVIGAPGVGKTSLVLAGLVPRHARGPATPWLAVTIVGAANPFVALADGFARVIGGPIEPSPEAVAAALARWHLRSPGAHLLVVADPLADLLAAADAHAPRLLRGLWELAVAPAPRVTVVVTLRTAELSRWGHLVVDGGQLRLEQVAFDDRHRLLVGPLDEAGLRDAIVEPLRRVGLGADPGLVERAVRDAAELGAPLPLLQHTLARLWERRRGPRLTLAGYDEVGGIAGSLDRFAEAALERLDDDRRGLARRLLVRLVRVDAGGDVRPLAGLRLDTLRATAPTIDAIVDALVGAGLLTRVDADTVALAHEELIRRWKRFAAWIDQDHQRLLDLGTLQQWVDEWRAHGTLLDDTRIGYARTIAGHNLDDLDTDTRDLLAASERTAAAARDQAAEQRATLQRSLRRTRVAVVLAAALALAAVLALAVALARRHAAVVATAAAAREARDAERSAEDAREASRRTRDVIRLAAAELLEADPTTGIELLREVDDVASFTHWRHAAVTALWQPISTSIFRHPAQVVAAAWSPTTDTVLTAAEDGVVRLWSPGDLVPRVTLPGDGRRLTTAAFAPAGDRIATASWDGAVRLWRVDGTLLDRVGERDAIVTHLAFEPTGQALVTADAQGSVRRWDLRGRRQTLLASHAGAVHALALAWDGAAVATAGADRTARLTRLPAGASTIVARHDNAVLAVSLGPDGDLLLTASRDGAARLVDLARERSVGLDASTVAVTATALSPAADLAATANAGGRVQLWRADEPSRPLAVDELPAAVSTLAFSLDGRRLAAGADDGTVRVIRVDAAGSAQSHHGHTARITSLRFSPSSTALLSASRDGTARIWADAPAGAPLRLVDRDHRVDNLAISPDGTQVLSGADDGGLRLWALGSQNAPAKLPPHAAPVTRVGFDPTGVYLVSAAGDGSVRLWLRRDPTHPIELPGPHAAVTAVAFDPSGRRLVVAASDGAVHLHDIAVAVAPGAAAPPRPASTPLVGHTAAVTSARFSATGLHVITASEDTTALVWSVADPRRSPRLLRHAAAIHGAEFSPSGRRVVTASEDATALLWTLDRPTPLPLRGHGAGVRAARFAPDEAALLTAGADGLIHLWSLTGDLLDTLATRDASPAVTADFSPDGALLGALDEAGCVQVWRLRGAAGPAAQIHVHTGVTAHQFVFHPNGRQVLTAEADAAVLRTLLLDLDDAALRAQLWRATSNCLTYAVRRERLGDRPLDALIGLVTCHARRAVVPP